MHLVDIPENPIPDGALAGHLATPDGMRLRFARWPALGDDLRGTVCVFTGRAEFIEKYFETVADLRERGFAVAVLDWRGQGGSQRLLKDPRRGHIDSFEQYDRDLESFMRDIVLPDCPAPYFALGHSMGGAVLLRNSVRRPNWFERMTISAPLLGLAPRRMSGRPLAFTVELLCLFGFADWPVSRGRRPVNDVPFEGNEFTSDPVRFARTNAITHAVPSLGIGSPTLGWVNAALEAMKELADPDFALNVAVPVLMVGAGRDAIVSTQALESLAFRLKHGSQIVLPGARHEILMERDIYREQFWAAFDAFVPGTTVFA